jgi:probable phosphoglycerate mutase
MDSKLVVEQMSGRWQVKHPSMRPLVSTAKGLVAHFDEVTFEWIPRERNTHADRLANEAMDRADGKPTPASGSRSLRSPAETSSPGGGTWTPPSQTPTRLILVRHGATAHSVDKRFSGRNDLPLSEIGVQQAEALARRAATFGEVTAVVASPLVRTRETATAIAAALGVPVDSDDDLVEVDFGAWEGLTFAQARAAHPEELTDWLGSVEVAPPGGESFAAAARRVRRGRDAVIAAHAGRTVVVVTHVTPIKTILGLALDAFPASLFRIHLDTASVSSLDYYADGNTSVRLVNDTSHLAHLTV